MVWPADRLPGLTCWLVTLRPWLASDWAISAEVGPGTMAPSTLSTSIASAPLSTGMASEIARALSVEPFQANRMRLPTVPLKPCGTTRTGRPESNSAVSNTLSGILGSAPGWGMTIRS